MDEIIIIPVTKKEQDVLFGLLEKYDKVEKETQHPYIKKISQQRKTMIWDLLGIRERG